MLRLCFFILRSLRLFPSRCSSGLLEHLRSFPPRRSSDLLELLGLTPRRDAQRDGLRPLREQLAEGPDRKSTRLNSSHRGVSYAVFSLKKKRQRCISDADFYLQQKGQY